MASRHRNEGGRFFEKRWLGKQRLFRFETIAIYFSPDVKNAVGRGREKIYTRIKLPRDFVTRKAAFSGWSGTTRRVFRCKSAAARCPGEHRNQDRKLVYTWRRWRQMVVTYDGVDPPPPLLSFSLSLLSQTLRLNHTRNIYDTAYHVSIYLIVGVVARIPLYIQKKKNHVYVTCHIRHFFIRVSTVKLSRY